MNNLRIIILLTLLLKLTACTVTGCVRCDNKESPFEYLNNVDCPIVDSGEFQKCTINGELVAKCNVIKNVTNDNLTASISINQYKVDRNGNELFKSFQKIEKDIGANSPIAIDYFEKCDLGTVNSGVHLVSKVHSVHSVHKSKNSEKKVKTVSNHLAISNLCSEKCLSDNPSSDCFITKLDISNSDLSKYKSALAKLSIELKKDKTINSNELLDILGASSSVCTLGEIQYSDGVYKTEQTNCGFKTNFIGETKVIGKWDDRTIFSAPHIESNHVDIMFLSGPEIWFIDKNGSEDITLNRTIAGQAQRVEFLESSIHIELPTVCLSNVIN